MKKTLIAYFSRKGNNYFGGSIKYLEVGNTEVAARKIQQSVGGDLFHIQTVRSYSEDYETCTREAKEELRNGARPQLKDIYNDMDDVDLVILGYPNWWGTMPMGVYTFLESYDLSGKIIAPFCTHEGSGMGHSERDIGKVCPKGKILPGLALRGSRVGQADSEIAAWLKALPLGTQM